MMKCKSIELLGLIQTIELKRFGCYVPLHFPKDPMMASQTEHATKRWPSGGRVTITGPDDVGCVNYAVKCAS